MTGINWSPGLLNPFRQVEAAGRTESLDTLLERQRVDEDCVMVLHLASPVPGVIAYANRGKSEVHLPGDMSEALAGAVTSYLAFPYPCSILAG